MRKALIVTLAIVAMAGAANAQILGTDHDLKANDTATGQICVFCHTPHNAAPDVPLWNHTLSGNTFTAYDSATMQAVDNNDWTGAAGSVSALCMSCHDGSIGLGSLINPGTATPNNAGTPMGGAVPANLGTDLSNDHPVAFTYDAALVTADGELADPTTIGLDLFGAGADQLECGTCHDPHDNTNAPFLVMSNNASALCLTCHNK